MTRAAHALKVMGSNGFPSWATPEDLYASLNGEFAFDFDPCPLGDARIWDGRMESWAGRRVYCNPPYGRDIASWLAKAYEAVVAVYLLPARTDTKWWHEHAPRAAEVPVRGSEFR